MTADFFICVVILGIGFPVQVESVADTVRDSFPNLFASKNDDFTSRLIIDTDAGSDDGVAILNILGAEELFGQIKVLLITTVAGNTHSDNVAKNVLKILKTARRLDIPVYKGSNASLLITPETDNYFGNDGFGDFNFSNPPSLDLIKKKHAVNALIEFASSYSEKVSLVCLGPLTNIALAIRMDPNFLSNFKQIFVLGGSDSGEYNVKPGVEFNFYVDPEAVFVVLKEAEKKNILINLVTWETAGLRNLVSMNNYKHFYFGYYAESQIENDSIKKTSSTFRRLNQLLAADMGTATYGKNQFLIKNNSISVFREWRKNVLGVLKSPQVSLINNAERLTLHGEHWVSSDTILSSVVLDEKIIEVAEDRHIDIETCGKYSRAATFVSYESEKVTKNIRLIKKINVDEYKSMLLQNLNPRGGQTNGASSTIHR